MNARTIVTTAIFFIGSMGIAPIANAAEVATSPDGSATVREDRDGGRFREGRREEERRERERRERARREEEARRSRREHERRERERRF